MTDQEYISELNNESLNLIVNDANTIKSLVQNIDYTSIVVLLCLPQMATYYYESNKILEIYNNNSIVDFQIQTIRNTSKMICDRYNKTLNNIIDVDMEQDQLFREKARCGFIKQKNQYDNLGVFFDKDGHIVGNTHLIRDILKSSALEDNKEIYLMGNGIGRYIGYIHKVLQSNFMLKDIELLENVVIGYRDVNTNIETDLFSYTQDKGVNLLFLRLVSVIGTDKYIIQSVLPNDNTWKLRNKYITGHNVWSSLKNIYNHFRIDNNNGCVDLDKLEDLVKDGQRLFPSTFRNCMMHYSFIDKGIPVIKEENYDANKMFCGLVENCFGGLSCDEYYSKLNIYMCDVEKYINTFFYVDKSKIRWDL